MVAAYGVTSTYTQLSAFPSRIGCGALLIFRGRFHDPNRLVACGPRLFCRRRARVLRAPFFEIQAPPSQPSQLVAKGPDTPAVAASPTTQTAPPTKQASNRPPELFPEARQAIIRTLKDPDSARFGRIFEGRGVIGKATICGEVNAKNGFGGYTGMTPFVYFPDDDRAELITDPVTLQMTPRRHQCLLQGLPAFMRASRRRLVIKASQTCDRLS